MMNAGGYNQANMRGHMTLMPGSSPMYHAKGGVGQDPYGYGIPPTMASMTRPSPTAARSFTESGSNMYASMGQQPSFPPISGQAAYFAAHGQDNAGMHASQQNRFGEVPAQRSVNYPPLRDPPVRANKAECQEECAEEECGDAEQCGNEQSPPKPENLWWGIDTRPFLPILLSLSTVVGMIFVMVVHVPLFARMFGMSETVCYSAALPLYFVTLAALAYSAMADPGQLRKDYQQPPVTALISGGKDKDECSTDAEEDAQDQHLPRRAHKCWQYQRAVRRYDHYCRWLKNVIGLLNHREFFTMVVGLVGIGLLGIVLNLVLLLGMHTHNDVPLRWGTILVLCAHFLYSAGLVGMAGPILKIHFALVCRNEVAHEWKKNTHYIVKTSKLGENVNVNALSDDEFNALFDSFVYDKTKNPFDKGCPRNCWNFWCTARWREDQLGDF